MKFLRHQTKIALKLLFASTSFRDKLGVFSNFSTFCENLGAEFFSEDFDLITSIKN